MADVCNTSSMSTVDVISPPADPDDINIQRSFILTGLQEYTNYTITVAAKTVTDSFGTVSNSTTTRTNPAGIVEPCFKYFY